MLLLLTKIKIAVCLSHYLECLVVENHTVYGKIQYKQAEKSNLELPLFIHATIWGAYYFLMIILQGKIVAVCIPKFHSSRNPVSVSVFEVGFGSY